MNTVTFRGDSHYDESHRVQPRPRARDVIESALVILSECPAGRMDGAHFAGYDETGECRCRAEELERLAADIAVIGPAVCDVVMDFYGPDPRQPGRRTKGVAFARHVAIHLINQLTEQPYRRIAQVVGITDHSSVSYALDKVRLLIAADNTGRFRRELRFLLIRARVEAQAAVESEAGGSHALSTGGRSRPSDPDRRGQHRPFVGHPTVRVVASR